MRSRHAVGLGHIHRGGHPPIPTGPARERRPDVAGWLRKKRRQDPRAAALAESLAACTCCFPCGSGACPACGEALQHELASAVDEFIDKHRRRRGTVVFVTVALPGSTVPMGGLAGVNMQALRRRTRYALDKAGVGWAIGALDYSLNEHKTERYEPCWLIHLHLVTVTDDPEALRRRLTAACPASDAVPRPVRVQEWDGRDNALLYLLKMKFARRVGFDDAERFSPRTGGWRRCRATSQQRLRSAERLELLLHLDGIGPDGRLFMRKAQLRRTRDGLAIVAMP